MSPKRKKPKHRFSPGEHSNSMMHSTVTVQTISESQPATPHWMGELAAFAQLLQQTGTLAAITDQVRFARPHGNLRSHRFCGGPRKSIPRPKNRAASVLSSGL